jgi:hypothetical protein
VRALDQQIRAHDRPAIRRGQHRGIVADADDGDALRRCQRPYLCDQAEFTEVGNGNGGLPR